MKVRGVLALGAVALMTVGCGASDPVAGPADDGRLVAAFGFDGPTHDVAFMGYEIYAGAVDCATVDAPPVASATVPLEEEFLPLWLEADGSGGDMHPFADALFVLQPGEYTACATPLTDALEPSEHCAPTSGTATVMPEMTTEIVLYAQCLGDPTGALDVVVALNDPPHISNLTIDPSKFIVCEEAVITVEASDPNGDALSYAWSFVSPSGVEGTVEGDATIVFDPSEVGAYTFTVVVTDGHGGSASLSFPLHASECVTDCSVDGVDLNCAEEEVYIHDGSTLYTFDPVAVAAFPIAPFTDAGTGDPILGMFDIAIDPIGRLYAVTGGGDLYLVDAVTAECTFVGFTGSFKNALTFRADGTLYGAGGSTVTDIDPGTAAESVAATSGLSSAGDLVATPAGVVYWTVNGGAGSELAEVDLVGGTAAVVGALGVPNVYGLAWGAGLLWGFSDAGLAITIDPVTGTPTGTFGLPGAWFGATSNTSLF